MGGGATLEEAARFETVDDAGDVRGVAGEGVGDPAHRQRLSGLEEPEHVALRRRQAERGGDRRQAAALREQELEEQLPGLAAVRIRHLGHGGKLLEVLNT